MINLTALIQRIQEVREAFEDMDDHDKKLLGIMGQSIAEAVTRPDEQEVVMTRHFGRLASYLGEILTEDD